MELKEATYRVYSRPAKVAYLVEDQEVYFTGIDQNGSTINWAEKVVAAICEAEGIQRKEYTFYDVQTGTGYSGHESGYCQIDQLVISEEDSDKFHVTDWRPVAMSRDHKGAEVYKEVSEAFKRFIV